jgi:hypothetical protein
MRAVANPRPFWPAPPVITATLSLSNMQVSFLYICVQVSGAILIKARHQDKRYKLNGGLIFLMLHCNNSISFTHHDPTARRLAGL